MAESAALVTKVTSANVPDTTPTNVAVVSDSSSNARQIVVLGAGDGTTTLVDGTTANPVNTKSLVNDGTNTANVVAGDSGFNGIATASGVKTYSFTTSATGVQTLLAATSCEGYQWIEIILTAASAGLAWTCPFSPTSGGTYAAYSTWSSSTTTTFTGALGVTTATFYAGPTKGNFFQLAISAATSGTTTGTVTLRALAPPISNINIPGTTTVSGTVGVTGYPSAAASADAYANPTITQIGAENMVYNGTSWDRARSAGVLPLSASTGIVAAAETRIARGTSVTPTTTAYQVQALADLVGAGMVSTGGTVTATVASGTQASTIKTGAGRLCKVIVTTAGTVVSTLYDNTSASGTVIGIIPAAAVAGSMYDIQMPCATGIYCSSASGGAALTISYT